MNDVACINSGTVNINAKHHILQIIVCNSGDTNAFRCTDVSGNDITSFKERDVVYFTNTSDLSKIRCSMIVHAYIIQSDRYSYMSFMTDKKLIRIDKNWDGTLPQSDCLKVLVA